MNIFAKSLISSLMASLFIVSVPSIATEKEVERRIAIKAEQGKNVVIHVDEDSDEKVIMMSLKDLSDNQAMEEKLKVLDHDTLEKVKKALTQVKTALKNANQEIEIHQLMTDGQDIELIEEMVELEQLKELLSDEQTALSLDKNDELKERKLFRKYQFDGGERVIVIDGSGSHIVHNDDDHTIKHFKLDSDNIILKGHVDAILKMINHGQFSSDELDKLQQALDQKR